MNEDGGLLQNQEPSVTEVAYEGHDIESTPLSETAGSCVRDLRVTTSELRKRSTSSREPAMDAGVRASNCRSRRPLRRQLSSSSDEEAGEAA